MGVGIRHGCGVSGSAKKFGHGCPENTDKNNPRPHYNPYINLRLYT
uniref:Uncharacterized protein n=1 Tax=Arundo donax TaxID=35708 RepID=A0A0A9FMA5_ARUDO